MGPAGERLPIGPGRAGWRVSAGRKAKRAPSRRRPPNAGRARRSGTGRAGRLDSRAIAQLRKLPSRFPALRRALLSWFEGNRRDYPWRGTDNWFHLLMAEMMLRRTRADQVVPVYVRFTERYPNPAATAGVETGTLEALFEPLGLRWRARQMAGTLHYLRHSFAQHEPHPQTDLRAIPGVGDYSEAMLRNRLFDEPRAAVDANVVRIFLRWQGLPPFAEARRDREMWELGNRFVRHERSQDLNLALLDFGSLVCRPVRPRCGECPLTRLCRGRSTETVSAPRPRGRASQGKKKPPQRTRA